MKMLFCLPTTILPNEKRFKNYPLVVADYRDITRHTHDWVYI